MFWYVFLLGCAHEKQYGDTQSSLQEDVGIDRNLHRDIQLITCIQFERKHWEEMDMCKIHLQFYIPTPQNYPQEEDIQEGMCLYEEGVQDEPPLFTEKGIDAGVQISLKSDQQELLLNRAHSETEGVFYAVENCREETFPFGAVFDIAVSGSSLPEGVPPFVLEDAIYIGSDIRWDTPKEERISHDPDEDWSLLWSFLHEKDSDIESKRRITVENRSDRLQCTPHEEELQIHSSDLLRLEYSQESMVFFEEMIIGPPKTLPWGMDYHSVMVYRTSGDVRWDLD